MLGILNEIEKQVLKEFDFDREARALSHMRRHLMPRFNNVIIPEPFLEYCNNQMIIMEYIPGVRLLDGVMDEFKSISRRLGVDFDSLRNGQQPISLSLRLQFSTLYFLDSFFDLAHTVIATCFNYTLGLGFGKMSYPKHKIDKKTVMKTLIDIQGYQILIGRLFQGDPHLVRVERKQFALLFFNFQTGKFSHHP